MNNNKLKESTPVEHSDWSTYKRLLSYVLPYWYLLVICLVGFSIAASAEVYFARLLGDLINDWDNAAKAAVITIPVIMFATAVARALGTIVGETFISRVSFHVVYNLRSALFENLLTLPTSYFDHHSQGHIVNRIAFTVAQLRDTGTDALRSLIQDSVKIVALLAAMLMLNWEITLIFLATTPALAIVVALASSRFRRISRRIQNSMGDVTHVTSEATSGFKEIRIFAGQEYERNRFERFNRTNRQQNLKMAITKVASAQLNELTISIAVCVMIFLLYESNMNSGDAVAFMTWAGLLGRPIKKLSEVNAKLQRGLAASEDVFAQLDEQPEHNKGDYSDDMVTGNIEFKNVYFDYSTSEGVLKNINLSVPAGHTVALVGRSGSGKSTIANLIPRFYDVASGEILIDGKNVKDYELESLRNGIALVSQQVTLFNDTLRNNVAYGALSDCSDEAINEALRQAHATEFVEQLVDGIDTIVGDDGVLLSGGQRQRIAIARALLKDAPILVLDEATSALDNESERHIQQALEAVMQSRTTIVIAHRLSTIESADTIVVLDEGEIVEEGDHNTLLDAGGAYTELHQAAFSEDERSFSKTTNKRTATLVGAQNKPKFSLGFERHAVGIGAAWYNGAWWLNLLRPLSWVYNFFRERRLKPYESGKVTPERTNLPVIVVGNITVGGTGKTPLVGWLVEFLRGQGFKPGVVMRGYGGKLSKVGTIVPSGADPERYSDEAVQLRDRLGCAVAISANRVKGVRLLEVEGCDVVVSDDGLQHYNMARDLEIAVIDGTRGIGNGRLLPAGPLREPKQRLSEVDWVITNGETTDLVDNATLMQMRPVAFCNLVTDLDIDCEEFVQRYPLVNAVCGIGNPDRFYHTLSAMGMEYHEHSFPDHYEFKEEDILAGEPAPVVCTEKDAAKFRHLEADMAHMWYLRVVVDLPENAKEHLQQLLVDRAITPKGRPAPHLTAGQVGDINMNHNINPLQDE